MNKLKPNPEMIEVTVVGKAVFLKDVVKHWLLSTFDGIQLTFTDL